MRHGQVLFLAVLLPGCVGLGGTGVADEAGREGEGRDGPDRCASFAVCFFADADELVVVVHASTGLELSGHVPTVLADQVLALSGRGVRVEDGEPVGELPETMGDGAIRRLHAGGGLDVVHVYVLATRRVVGGEAASGLSFPGSPALFLFPAAMDGRVADAALAADDAAQARRTLESVVAVHELGHALGLVGCGLPMQVPHADPDSACHSANATSLMHARVARVTEWPAWDAEAPLGPFGWDRDDLADIAAVRDA